jgi:formate hydrogenlyase subunit 3/multisubunit Na+/H+ antiporter MnhD subunit
MALLLLPAFAGAVLGLVPSRRFGLAALALCGASCVAGMLAYPMFLGYGAIECTFPVPSAWGPYSVAMDGLSALMVSFSSLVFLMVVAHMSRSRTAQPNGKGCGAACAMFAACALSMCADSALLLLLSWEGMTLAAFFMSCNGENAGARWRFLVTTHFGGLMIVCAFAAMASAAGSWSLSGWSGLGSEMGLLPSCAAAALLFAGFGTKLGLVPFHAWMPDLYSSAPTHSSALLSTVSSSAAVLILFKSVFGYIGVTGDMYPLAVALMGASALTAVWSAMESLVQNEPRRILAFSGMENMSLVLLCMSLAMLFSHGGSQGLVAMALVAALLHALNHSVFKSLIMLAVGTVEDCTGETDIERMGGLAKLMPAFSAVALVAVLSMAAVPPFNGFASEWLMVQSMMDGEGLQMAKVLLPIGVAVLGVSGMMSAASYARLYGFVFLGRPRSESVRNPKRVGRAGFAAMAALAFMCLAMGLAAAPMMGAVHEGVSSVMGLPPGGSYADELAGTLDAPMLGGLLLASVFAVYGAFRLFRKKSSKAPTWGCGGPLEDGMQYSSIGFSQPLVRVFHPLYGDVAEMAQDGKGGKRYTLRFTDPFDERIVVPAGRLTERASRRIGRTQNGNIQSYFGYMLAALVALLLAVRFL